MPIFPVISILCLQPIRRTRNGEMTKFRGFFRLIFSSSVSRRETQCEINTKHSRTNVEGYLAGCSNTHTNAEFREAKFFPVNIFRTPDKLFDSINNPESHDVKNDRIPFPVLKILILA